MLTKKLAVDLGTSNSIVYMRKRGILLMEPTVVAISEEDGSVLAVGSDAKKMLGRTPEDIKALKPLKSGVIADYQVTEVLLRYFINKAIGTSRLIKPDVIISIPAGATSVESRAVLDAAYSAGAKRAYLVPEPLAAAIGAGLPVSQPSGNIIVNIGGGTTEIAVVSLYGIVTHGSVRVGGNDFDDAIIQYLRRKHGLVVGEGTSEGVKISLGTAVLPKTRIAMTVKSVLESTPPELSADILDKGIVLSGGTSQLKNIDKYMSNYIGVPVHVADEPILCVVKGLAIVLDQFEEFSKSMIKR